MSKDSTVASHTLPSVLLTWQYKYRINVRLADYARLKFQEADR
jgi:hypothetical protein